MIKPTLVKPLVCLTWLDAQSSATQPYTEDTIPHDSIPMKTYGLLLRDDEKGVSLFSETYWDDLEHRQTYRGHTFVPRGMVVSVEVLVPGGSKKAALPAAPKRRPASASPHGPAALAPRPVEAAPLPSPE